MARAEEKQTLKKNLSPLREREEEDDMNDYEEKLGGGGCGCLGRFFCLKWWGSEDKENRYLLQQRGEYTERWWVNKLKGVKETSEVLAGPKWKTFIRKFGGYRNINKKQRNPFQYDAESYALNFDGGVNREEDDDDLLFDFSATFAPPPPPTNVQRQTGLSS